MFHHGSVEEWGAKQPQTDSFAIIHPKNKKRKHGLYNVSFRRLQQFKIAPHEKIAYSFGDKTGIVEADENGLLTLEQLELTQTPQTIFLKRTVQA